jgi:hypothetical protein
MIKSNRIASLTGSIALLVVAASSTAAAQPTKSFKDPITGQDCVKVTSSENSSSGNFVYVKYHNSCGVTFGIWWESKTAAKHSTGIGPYGDSQHTVPAKDFDGFEWWVD